MNDEWESEGEKKYARHNRTKYNNKWEARGRERRKTKIKQKSKCKPTNETHVHNRKPYLPINRITRNTHWTIWRQINFSQLHSPVHTVDFIYLLFVAHFFSPRACFSLVRLGVLMSGRARTLMPHFSLRQWYFVVVVVVIGFGAIFSSSRSDEEWFVDEISFLVSNVLKTDVTIIFMASCVVHQHGKCIELLKPHKVPV